MVLLSGRLADRSLILWFLDCTPASAILLHCGATDKGHHAHRAACGRCTEALPGAPAAGLA